MANEEERELESIIRETEAPSRINGKEKLKTKIAKLTGRTIFSLRTKIKDRRLSKAYEKYNKKYAEMRRALVDANKVRAAQQDDPTITSSQVVEEYDVVASYSKKLSKLAVKLLEEDIERIVADKKAKPIRVPRILIGKMRTLVRAIGKKHDKIKSKKLQKGEAKDIKKTTKDYIQSSLQDALFKDIGSGELRSQVDTETIKNLKLDNSAENFEDKIANLKKFISKDGKNPVFSDDEISKENKPNTDIPPVEPTASVPKEEVKLSAEDLLGNLGTKKENEENTIGAQKPNDEPQVQSRITLDDLMKNLNSSKGQDTSSKQEENIDNKGQNEEKTEQAPVKVELKLDEEDKHAVSKRKREVSTILSIGRDIEILEKQASRVNDPETKEMIQGYIEGLKNELDQIIARSTLVDNKKEETHSITLTADDIEKKDEVLSNSGEQVTPLSNDDNESSLEAITIQPKEEEKIETDSKTDKTVSDGSRIVQWADGNITTEPAKKNSMENVEVKESESMRATQVAAPSAVRVTPQDIKNMEDRNKEAQLQIANLRRQREDLENQRKMLQEYIEVAKTTREAELQAQEMARSNATLAGEVAELSSQAAAINSDLGRSK